MPELAEVEFYRRQWDAGLGQVTLRVHTHPAARIFRECVTSELVQAVTGHVLTFSEAQAKQMLFRFGPDRWMGLHLGMSGTLASAQPEMVPGRHDHLVLFTPGSALVFNDPRMFGRVRLHRGMEPPSWWTKLPPPVVSEVFTPQCVAEFCARRSRSPIKAVLLMQERFPGIGNWMADEILWRARIHPACPAGNLTKGPKLTQFHRIIQEVAADALREIAGTGKSHAPSSLSDKLPDSWLFNHRWTNGGICPKTRKPLRRATIGGRTTCFSPAWQSWGVP